MKKLSNIISGIFLVLVFIAGIIFTYSNTAQIGLTFGNLVFLPRPVSVWIVGAFVCGSFIGLILGLGIFRQLKARAEVRRLGKELEKSQEEVNRLRSLSLKDLQ